MQPEVRQQVVQQSAAYSSGTRPLPFLHSRGAHPTGHQRAKKRYLIRFHAEAMGRRTPEKHPIAEVESRLPLPGRFRQETQGGHESDQEP